jgi:Ni,Fe-hydrogenase I large subunit
MSWDPITQIAKDPRDAHFITSRICGICGDNHATCSVYAQNIPPDSFKGIDIMRAVRSFDPCLPCGVHMYVGGGRTISTTHSPTGVTLAT